MAGDTSVCIWRADQIVWPQAHSEKTLSVMDIEVSSLTSRALQSGLHLPVSLTSQDPSFTVQLDCTTVFHLLAQAFFSSVSLNTVFEVWLTFLLLLGITAAPQASVSSPCPLSSCISLSVHYLEACAAVWTA